MSDLQHRSSSIPASSPEPATRAMADLVSVYQNRLEDGDRPGHRLISAGLAPKAADRAALEDRKAHLLNSLSPPGTDDERRAMAKIVAALLGAFPTFGADREDAKATVTLVVRALDDVPVWSVQRAASRFLKGTAQTRWSEDRAPTPPQIRAEAKLICLEVETELYRIAQVLDAEIVDSETTEDERKSALAHWNRLKADLGRSNIITERTGDEIAKERAEQIRANEAVERRDALARERAGLPPAPSPFAPREDALA